MMNNIEKTETLQNGAILATKFFDMCLVREFSRAEALELTKEILGWCFLNEK